MATDVYEFDKTAIANYASFGSWISAMGVANKSIIIATDTEITGTVTVPSNIDIAGFYNGAKFTGTGTLTINKMSCDPQHQIFDSTLTAVTVYKDTSVDWYGAIGDGTTDSTAAIQKALASTIATKNRLLFGIGTYLTNATVDLDRVVCLHGKSQGYTTIKAGSSFVGEAVILAPLGLTDVVINGDNVNTGNPSGQNATAVIGVYGYRDATTQKAIYYATLGNYKIINCSVAGLKMRVGATTPGSSGMYYNELGNAKISWCGIGVHLISDTLNSRVNSNHFNSLFILSCTTGLEIERADNQTFDQVTLEGCTTGLNLIKGRDNLILGGRLEGNTTDINLADSPDVLKFDASRMSIESTPVINYTYSSARSVFLPSENFSALYGRVPFEHIDFSQINRYISGGPYMQGFRHGSVTVSSGATPDIKDASHVYLNYASPTTITNFITTDEITGWEQITIFANTNNARIDIGTYFKLVENWVPEYGDYLTLVHIPLGGGTYKWFEVSRSGGVAINPLFYGFGMGGATFTSNDATLDIGWSGGIYQTVILEYTTPISILDFTATKMIMHQILLIKANNSNGYIVNSGNFILNGDWRPSNNDTLLLYRYPTGGGTYKWVEITRGGAGSTPVRLPSYTVTTLPTASNYAGCQIYVSDETGGAVPAFSDGTNWRRVTDRAIVA